MGLRACSAMSGTETAYAATSLLRASYTVPGTDLAYAATRFLRDVRSRDVCMGVRPRQCPSTSAAMGLRACYALSGTERAYAATSARDIAMDMQCYRQYAPTNSRTVRGYQAWSNLMDQHGECIGIDQIAQVPSYAPATPCPLLAYGVWCYACAMSGTDLRVCGAMSGTDIGYAATTCYAVCGTDIRNAATRPYRTGTTTPTLPTQTGRYRARISLRACYAMSGTDFASTAICLCV
eukprot:2879817-Rhodomonas_salina.4